MIATIAVIFVFSIVVLIHELGHFLACRAVGVRVERFALGFGKEVFGFDWKGTRWSICILPLGGFVKPAGEDSDQSSGATDEYFSKTWYQRILIAVSGPTMNYVLAFVCFFILLFVWGQPTPSREPFIGEIVTGFPAHAVGLQKNDQILSVNGFQIQTWEDLSSKIHANAEQPIDLKIRRIEDQLPVEKIVAIIPKKDPQRGVGVIGISPRMDLARMSFVDSIRGAGEQCVFWTKMTLKYLGDAIVKRKKPELAGPVGIVSIIAKVSSQGFQELVSLIALISLSLGLFNFFPIPLLDGGHIMIYTLEGIFRRPLSNNAMRIANIVGATILIAIFVYATTQDFTRLGANLFK